MLTKDIEKLRELLNNMIDSESFAYSDILAVSQDLDTLISEYYRTA
jgi:hypothetical protein